MKPDWKDAPEWANYLAMDDDGSWCWYENRPSMGYSLWEIPENGNFVPATTQEPRIKWFESLEARPNEA